MGNLEKDKSGDLILTYKFIQTGEEPIDLVEIGGLNIPESGKDFNTSANCNTENVSEISSVTWTDVERSPIAEGTKVGYNTEYKAVFTLSGVEGCMFVDSTSVAGISDCSNVATET